MLLCGTKQPKLKSSAIGRLKRWFFYVFHAPVWGSLAEYIEYARTGLFFPDDGTCRLFSSPLVTAPKQSLNIGRHKKTMLYNQIAPSEDDRSIRELVLLILTDMSEEQRIELIQQKIEQQANKGAWRYV
jgi:hypothetical protein